MLKNFAIDPRPSRRRFLQGGAAAAAGLTIGFHWSAGGPKFASAATSADGAFAPNAFVRIAADNSVTVLSKHLEMGQGVYTGLATIVAEELDADWSQIRVAGAPADASLYNNLQFGPVQGTGGSSSIANSYDQLRKAGATARAMLINAAAKEWGVDRAGITVEKGVVSHAASGRSATFGKLAPKAAGLPVPPDVPLKDPSRFTLIGTSVPRVDTTAKTTGRAQFALDMKLPGMLTAVIARPPVFGATVKSVDASAAQSVPGVVKVVQVPSGVAVVAKNFWAASKAREALAIQWDESGAETRGMAELLAEYKALAEKPGAPARRDGDAAKVLAGAAKTITAAFQFPYLAHAPMEPLDCVVRLEDARCQVWAGDQFQTIDQGNAAAAAGMKPGQVEIHTLVAGGSFGRRANAASDYIVEAVHIAKALDRGTPVKLVWTREDDIRGGRGRPMYYHTLTAGLDA
jgi:isoquinoline 1-oxidoreductase beta subunit